LLGDWRSLGSLGRLPGSFGGEAHDGGVLNGAVVMRSRKASSCRNERALCRVSSGRIGGTPPHPSIAANSEMTRSSNHAQKFYTSAHIDLREKPTGHKTEGVTRRKK